VFVPNVEGEWIHPERATVAEVAELARNCPSGAIRFETAQVELRERAPLVNLVQIRENGPLALHAPLTIAGADAGFRATLCRCGASRNKPYCDGSHAAAGFQATGEPAPQLPSQAAPAARDGAVSVALSRDGPLLLKGAIEVVTGTGRTVARLPDAALCRCGHSGNKPFCDGSHRGAGFKADAAG
jgi:CDGSH-type Zn-finger protein